MPENNDDSRTMCKYGTDCYQRNPEHHKKFKHPKRCLDEASESALKRNKHESPNMMVCKPTGAPVSECGEEEVKRSEPIDENVNNLPTNIKGRIESVFLTKMPDDFFSFYDFCMSLDKAKPHSALSAVGIQLVGPFDLFGKPLKNFTLEEGLRHYRYYFDPPEFQTILSCDDKNQLHYGYFRDSPNEMPAFIGSNEASVSCVINIVSENIFSAVNCHIDNFKKTADPFKKMKIQKIQHALVNWSKRNDFGLDTLTTKIKNRRSKVVSKTFHGAGIVVPYDKKTQLGYRELKENDKSLKQILKNLCEAKTDEERKLFWTKLHPVITYANIANDEFDFGASLELGIDLFCFGDPLLHKTVLQILPTSYELLGRSEFATILCAHLQCRTKDTNLNTITH